jgi:hypothetical protein
VLNSRWVVHGGIRNPSKRFYVLPRHSLATASARALTEGVPGPVQVRSWEWSKMIKASTVYRPKKFAETMTLHSSAQFFSRSLILKSAVTDWKVHGAAEVLVDLHQASNHISMDCFTRRLVLVEDLELTA